MKVRVCPKCDKHNPQDAFHCVDCGTTLSIKTIMDTETGKMNVTPIAGETRLSSISMEYEQHVADLLNPVREYEEDVIWGCDIAKKGDSSYGFLILTSKKLICAYFVPPEKPLPKFIEALTVESAGCAFEALAFIFAPILDLIVTLVSSFRYVFFGVPDVYTRRESKFQTEGLQRRVTAWELKDLERVEPARRWEGDDHYTNVGLRFSQGDEIMLTFVVEQDAYRANKLLGAYINSGHFHYHRPQRSNGRAAAYSGSNG